MIKICGLIIVIVSSIFAGGVLANRVKLRIEELLYVKKILLMFRGELAYKNAMLPEAFLTVGVRARAPYDKLFKSLSKATEDNFSTSMSCVFNEAIEENLLGNTYLKKEDLVKLGELGDTLGYQNQTMQLSNVDLFVERLSVLIAEEQGKMNDTMKVYKTMSMMTGIFIAIVLL